MYKKKRKLKKWQKGGQPSTARMVDMSGGWDQYNPSQYRDQALQYLNTHPELYTEYENRRRRFAGGMRGDSRIKQNMGVDMMFEDALVNPQIPTSQGYKDYRSYMNNLAGTNTTRTEDGFGGQSAGQLYGSALFKEGYNKYASHRNNVYAQKALEEGDKYVDMAQHKGHRGIRGFTRRLFTPGKEKRYFETATKGIQDAMDKSKRYAKGDYEMQKGGMTPRRERSKDYQQGGQYKAPFDDSYLPLSDLNDEYAFHSKYSGTDLDYFRGDSINEDYNPMRIKQLQEEFKRRGANYMDLSSTRYTSPKTTRPGIKKTEYHVVGPGSTRVSGGAYGYKGIDDTPKQSLQQRKLAHRKADMTYQQGGQYEGALINQAGAINPYGMDPEALRADSIFNSPQSQQFRQGYDQWPNNDFNAQDPYGNSMQHQVAGFDRRQAGFNKKVSKALKKGTPYLKLMQDMIKYEQGGLVNEKSMRRSANSKLKKQLRKNKPTK
jgi:hypothetical protein